MTVHPNDVVVTGPPRAGTTLTMELLNAATDTVALDEPMDESAWTGRPARKRGSGITAKLSRRLNQPKPFDPSWFMDKVEEFFTTTRDSALTQGKVMSKNVGGKVAGAKFLDNKQDSGLRERITVRSMIDVEKDLTPDFVLAVKHNAGFTVALEHLVKRYRCYAIVRNPLSMISSWQTVPIPIQEGRVRRGEQADPSLKARLDATPDVLDRQFILLDWFFGMYQRFLPKESVLTYESMVETGGRSLAPISSHAASLDRTLESRNRAKVYDEDKMRAIAQRLLDTDGPWWEYYTRESVRDLVSAG